MKDSGSKIYTTALLLILRNVSRFCMRHSIKFRQFVAIAKEAFIESARDELEKKKIKESVSKLCVMTGLQRLDIGAILTTDHLKDKVENNLLTQLISQWKSDKRFSNNGKPKPLTTDTVDCDFVKLLRLFNTDLNHHTVLFELERLGIVERKGNHVLLKTSVFQPKGDSKRSYELLASDISDLINSVEENIQGKQPLHLHAKTEYDNIPSASLPEIRQWLLKEGTDFHEKVRKFMAKYDRDAMPENFRKHSSDTTRIRVGIGTFTFSENITKEQEHSERED